MLVKCLRRDWIHEVKSIGKLSLLKRDCLGVEVGKMLVDFGVRFS